MSITEKYIEAARKAAQKAARGPWKYRAFMVEDQSGAKVCRNVSENDGKFMEMFAPDKVIDLLMQLEKLTHEAEEGDRLLYQKGYACGKKVRFWNDVAGVLASYLTECPQENLDAAAWIERAVDIVKDDWKRNEKDLPGDML